MEKNIKAAFAKKVNDFSLPPYSELPDMGLYLEQVARFINSCMMPLGCTELTISMISNYVKKGVIDPPVRKQYRAEQIGYLFFVSVAKNVVSMEAIIRLLQMQRAIYDPRTAYEYFRSELDNILRYISGQKDKLDNIGVTNTGEKTLIRSVLTAACHVIFVNSSLEERKPEGADTAGA
ncbi:MAG: DUF1836 domain-containing protein [Ruminococcaceae bacterium]|nr:DUF1836 domain-containing protein [Oscillospiraceae bacterium]